MTGKFLYLKNAYGGPPPALTKVEGHTVHIYRQYETGRRRRPFTRLRPSIPAQATGHPGHHHARHAHEGIDHSHDLINVDAIHEYAVDGQTVVASQTITALRAP